MNIVNNQGSGWSSQVLISSEARIKVLHLQVLISSEARIKVLHLQVLILIHSDKSRTFFRLHFALYKNIAARKGAR